MSGKQDSQDEPIAAAEHSSGTVRKLPFSDEQLKTLSITPAQDTIGESKHRIPGLDATKLSNLPARATLVTDVGETHTFDSGGVPIATPIPKSDEPDFVLQEMIGRGGQGEVWSATQSSLQREIAVKIHRSGRVADFLIEAYTSGELDHPNIVPIHELARMYIDGKECPLLAMKLVKGACWLDLIADDREVDGFSMEVYLSRHIQVLLSVCHAVAYAHSKGIIHRDLKPHQVIVGEFGEVYLVDWGLAISLEHKSTKVSNVGVPKFRTLDLTWGVSGTPAYMAPEQTSESPEGLGIPTDIYLLGSTLYHLVAGHPPHNAHTAEAALFKAMMNEIAPLPDNCPNELHAIINQALATEPNDRYDDVDEFRRALEDYLSGAGRQRESRRILAEVRDELEGSQDAVDYTQLIALDQAVNRSLQLWPDNLEAETVHQDILFQHAKLALRLKDLRLALSLACQLDSLDRQRIVFTKIDEEQELQKKETRQRKVFFLSSMILVVLIPIVLFIFWLYTTRVEGESQQFETDRRLEASRRQLYMDRADLFAKAWELRASEEELADEMTGRIPMPQVILDVEEEALTPDEAEKVAALLVRRDGLRSERRELASEVPLQPPPAQLLLGDANVAFHQARDAEDYLAAFGLYRDIANQKPLMPEPHTGMGISAARAGFFTSATIELVAAAELTRRVRGERHQDTARSLALAANSYLLVDDSGEGHRELYQQSIDILEPQWADLSLRLADYWGRLGDIEAPVRYSSPTLTLYQRRYGDSSNETAEARQAVARNLRLQGHFPAAHQLTEQAHSTIVSIYGGDSVSAADSRREMAESLISLGRYGEAEKYLREAMEIYEENFGARDRSIGDTSRSLASLFRHRGQYEQALEYEKTALEIALVVYGEDHPMTAAAYSSYGHALSGLDRVTEAEEYYRHALMIFRDLLGEDHPETAQSYDDLAMEVLLKEGRRREAEILVRRSVNLLYDRLGAEHFSTAKAYANLARTLFMQGRFDEATAWYLLALGVQTQVYGESHPELSSLYADLGDMEQARQEPAKAFPLYRRSWENAADAGSIIDRGRFGAFVALRDLVLSSRPGYTEYLFILAADLEHRIERRERMTDKDIRTEYLPVLEGIDIALEKLPSTSGDLRRAVVVRAHALADFVKLPNDDRLRIEWLAPAADLLGLDREWAEQAPPIDFLDGGPYAGNEFFGWLDRVGPMPNWRLEFTNIEFDADQIPPTGARLKAIVDAYITENRSPASTELTRITPWLAQYHNGRAYHLLGEHDLAVKSLLSAAEAAGESDQLTSEQKREFRALAWYNAARSLAVLGQKERAWSYLEEAVRSGFANVRELREDEALEPLRQDDLRFQALLPNP